MPENKRFLIGIFNFQRFIRLTFYAIHVNNVAVRRDFSLAIENHKKLWLPTTGVNRFWSSTSRFTVENSGRYFRSVHSLARMSKRFSLRHTTLPVAQDVRHMITLFPVRTCVKFIDFSFYLLCDITTGISIFRFIGGPLTANTPGIVYLPSLTLVF